MDSQNKMLIVCLGVIAIWSILFVTAYQFQQAQATGCPVDTIIPFIDDAIKSLEAGDTQTALSQMQDAKNELSDTFEVEE